MVILAAKSTETHFEEVKRGFSCGQGWAKNIEDLSEIVIGVASSIATNDGIALEKSMKVFPCLPAPQDPIQTQAGFT